MTSGTVPHPRIVSRGEWLTERVRLLANEKELTKHRDQVNARAPLAKLEAYAAERGWRVPWSSSFGSDFNYDFHVTR